MTKQTHIYKGVDGWKPATKVWRYNGSTWEEDIMPYAWDGTQWEECMPTDPPPPDSYYLYLKTDPDNTSLTVESRLSGGTWSAGTTVSYLGSTYQRYEYDEGASVEIRTTDNSWMYFFEQWIYDEGSSVSGINTSSTTNTFSMPSYDLALTAQWIG